MNRISDKMLAHVSGFRDGRPPGKFDWPALDTTVTLDVKLSADHTRIDVTRRGRHLARIYGCRRGCTQPTVIVNDASRNAWANTDMAAEINEGFPLLSSPLTIAEHSIIGDVEGSIEEFMAADDNETPSAA